MDTNTTFKLSLKGRMDATPIGLQHIHLKRSKEHITISRPQTRVCNIMVLPKAYVDHVGLMEVKNWTTGMIVHINFNQAGWTWAGYGKLDGGIYQNEEDAKNKKNPICTIGGAWHTNLTMTRDKFTSSLWEASKPIDKMDWQYNFNRFALGLNQCPEELEKVLPRSDTRLRPDIRALENGDVETAAAEKHRLEEKQRAARKWRAENPGNDFQPKYFSKITDPDSGLEYYSYF